MKFLIVFGLLFAASVEASPFLDIYLRVYPSSDFCGADVQCNITYSLSLLTSQDFDLQSVKLQDETLTTRNSHYIFEDSTVFRLSKGIHHTLDKIYLGLRLFDVPVELQDYIIFDVTNVIKNGKRARLEFISDAMKVKARIYRRYETTELDNDDEMISTELDNGLLSGELHSLRGFKPGCQCNGDLCTCCRHFDVRKVRLNDIVCVNLTYVLEKHGFTSSLSVSGAGNSPHKFNKEIIDESFTSACVEMLREYATLCLRAYNFVRTSNEASVCIGVETKLYHVKVGGKKMGCLRLPI